LRRFLRHLAFFVAPLGLILLLAEGVLLGSGELWPMDRVIAYQSAHAASRFLRGIDQAFYAYKRRGILLKRPAILAAGSSRTMKFRAPMFGDLADSFFNAGGMVNSIRDLQDFLDTLPDADLPKTMVLGIDLWWLNRNVPVTLDFRTEMSKGSGWNFDEHVLGIRWLLRRPATFISEAAGIARGTKSDAIGLGARERGGGFRADGSMESAVAAQAAATGWRFVDRETPPIIERVETGTENFAPADGLDEERVAALDRALSMLEGSGVFVIGYLPPFSSAVLAVLQTDPRHSRLFADFRRRVPTLFERHGFPVLDASDPLSLGQDDRAMSDGEHAEETFHLHVVKALLREPRIRARLPGAEAAIDRALSSARTNFWEAHFEE
jgi:hypothetical protein